MRTLPAIPVGFTVRRSLGDTPDLTSVLANLPPDVTSALNQGSQLVSSVKPAFDLAATLASGGVASEQQVLAAVAAVAAAINPAAGAIIAVGGELLVTIQAAVIALYTDLGWIGNLPPTYNYVGLLRANLDTIPFSPSAITGAVDPNWLSFTRGIDLVNFINMGRAATSTALAMPDYSPNQATQTANDPFIQMYVSALLRQQPITVDTVSQIVCTMQFVACLDNPSANKLNNGTGCELRTPGVANAQGQFCKYLGWNNTDPVCASVGDFAAYSPDLFEIFFNTILRKNLEFWANGHAFVPAVQLLAAAAQVWNQGHGVMPQKTYQPYSYTVMSSQGKTIAPSSLTQLNGLNWGIRSARR